MKKQSFIMKRVVGLEYIFAAVLTGIFFVSVANFDWWWLIILFPLVDISMFGYLQNARAGALVYNAGHSLVGPAILLVLFILSGQTWELFVATIWLFHIFVDRALGMGLKHTEGFHHTHLGPIGKAKKKA